MVGRFYEFGRDSMLPSGNCLVVSGKSLGIVILAS
jgi:hypothetical protein